jgi:hypothetical protein
MQGIANAAFLSGFLCPSLPCVAPYCARGGIRVVSITVDSLDLGDLLLVPPQNNRALTPAVPLATHLECINAQPRLTFIAWLLSTHREGRVGCSRSTPHRRSSSRRTPTPRPARASRRALCLGCDDVTAKRMIRLPLWQQGRELVPNRLDEYGRMVGTEMLLQLGKLQTVPG